MNHLKRSLQENLLILLTYSQQHSVTIRNLVEPKYFDGVYRPFVVEIYAYLDNYKTPPAEHLPDLFADELEKDDQKAVHCERVIREIREAKDTVNPDYVIDKLSSFLSMQAMRSGIIEASAKLQQETDDALEDAEKILHNALDKRVQLFNPGIFMGDPTKALAFLRIDHDNHTFPTGIKELDHFKLGPTRQELHIFMGLTNRGKSWWLVQLGKHALMNRLKVCHISLEMSDNLVAQRYTQALWAIPKHQGEQRIIHFKRGADDSLEGLEEYVRTPPVALDDPGAEKHIREKMARWTPRLNNLIIKQFPTRQLTIPMLKGYLDLLDSAHGFVPDLLLLDYADIMHVDPKDYRIGTRGNYEHLRGIGVERDMAVATVTQSNREGAKATELRETHVGEDYSKLQTADTAIYYNQTQDESRYGLARLVVGKARNEQAHQTIFISQNYATGQFCRDSITYSDRYKEIVKSAQKAK